MSETTIDLDELRALCDTLGRLGDVLTLLCREHAELLMGLPRQDIAQARIYLNWAVTGLRRKESLLDRAPIPAGEGSALEGNQ